MSTTDQSACDIFLSYSRKDNAPILVSHPNGWVTAIRDHILADHRRFSTESLRIFFDVEEIKDMQDWRHRILGALRSSKIILICLSPNYFASPYCRWEWEEYLTRQVHKLMGSESVAAVYFVEVPGSDQHANARWLEDITRGNLTDIRPWFPEGAVALQRAEVQRRLAALGTSLWERIERARRAQAAPGNLRRQTPFFVGRGEELRRLHERLRTGAVGVVTALHGLGGQGKTELAVAYAHSWADCYPAGLWVLEAEGKGELLPLIGGLAFKSEFSDDTRFPFTPTEMQKNNPVELGRAVLMHLKRRVEALNDRSPDQGAAALLLLDNVSVPTILSPEQLATLPRADWFRILATTRLEVNPLKNTLVVLAVDSLDEDSALTLVRDRQPSRDAERNIAADLTAEMPGFASRAEEDAVREIVRVLGGFTLAVEQVAVFLGLHPEIAPSAFLAGLQAKGLASADTLVERDPNVAGQLLTQSKQLNLILEATLAGLDAPARSVLQFAAQLPPDTVPWPWLETLTVARHSELGIKDPFGTDPWLEIRRRLTGLRLLTPGDHPELARIHRLVAAHVKSSTAGLSRSCPPTIPSVADALATHIADRTWSICRTQAAPEAWELDALLVALPISLTPSEGLRVGVKALPLSDFRDLANAAIFFSEKVVTYRALPAAASLLASAHAVLKRIAGSDPSNAGWQRDLSVSYNKVGDVLRAQGDLAGAHQAYRESLAVRQRLAWADPLDEGSQRDLSVSHIKLGDVLRAQGDLAGALQAVRDSLAVVERLALADPSNAGWQRDLSISHNKVGDVLRAQGDLAGALKAYRESLAVRQRLSLANLPNAVGQRDLSVSHERIGDVLRAQGDLAEALKAYRESLAVIQRLALADPSNSSWQRDLSVSHNKVGNVLRVQGDLAGALKAYRESLAVIQRLALADPSNAGWQRDLSVSHNKVGDVLRAQGDLAGALKAFQEDLEISQRLALADPSNAGSQRDVVVSCSKMAEMAEKSGTGDALEWWRKAYEQLSRMKQRGIMLPTDETYLQQLRKKVEKGRPKAEISGQ